MAWNELSVLKALYSRPLRLVVDFYDSVINNEATACGMRVIGRGIEAITIATDEMDGGNDKFVLFSNLTTWKYFDVSMGLCYIDGRIAAKYKLTRDQIFFMNWLFKWHKEVQELYESMTGFTEKDLETLVETCKDDHEIVVPYPQDCVP
jgi:hypothetical protein